MWGGGAGACLESALRKAEVEKKKRTNSDDLYLNFMANPSPIALIIARFMAWQNGVFTRREREGPHEVGLRGVLRNTAVLLIGEI